MIDGKPVIYGITGANNGCTFYRLYQPISKLVEKDIFPAATTSMLQGADHELYLQKADVIVTNGHATMEKFLEYMVEQEGRKLFTIDYDDDIFNVSPYNPSYEKHGYREVDIELPDGRTIEIRDGKNGFNIAENKQRLYVFKECLRRANMVTTTCSTLSGIFKQLNKNTRVIKNFIDFNLWKPAPLVKDKWVRIGWQGGWSHYQDFCEIQEVLEEVMGRYANTRLVIMGTDFPGVMKNLPQDRIDLESWVSMEAYPYKFKTLNIDIGIAPLANNAFNHAKSEIKWEEYSALAIPTVASNIPPYSIAIQDNVTGFLCSTKEEWLGALGSLISNMDLRTTIGQNAQERVREHYDIDKEVEQYRQAYNSLYNKELILA